MVQPSVMATLRLGIVGCGSVVQRRILPALRLTTNWKVHAIASRSQAKAETYAALCGAAPVQGYAELLARSDIDAVYVGLPTALNEEWVVRALEAGKHVLCEKPLAVDHAAAGRMIDEARKRRLLVMENYMFVQHPQHAVVRGLVDRGAIGELRLIDARFTIPALPADDFRYDRALGGGALLDLGGYPIRLATLFVGDELSCTGARTWIDPDRGVDLYGSAILTDGAKTNVAFSFGFDLFYQCYYELVGSSGKIRVERAFTIPDDVEPSIQLERAGAKESVTAPRANHFALSFDHFAATLGDVSQFEPVHRSALAQARLRDAVRAASQ